MEYEQALIIGKRRRADAAVALGGYVRERVTDLCAVKPSKDAGLDARDWDPVGEENYKEICVRRGPTGDEEAYLVVVDADGRGRFLIRPVLGGTLGQAGFEVHQQVKGAGVLRRGMVLGRGAALWKAGEGSRGV
jgi:hypothetical protein